MSASRCLLSHATSRAQLHPTPHRLQRLLASETRARCRISAALVEHEDYELVERLPQRLCSSLIVHVIYVHAGGGGIGGALATAAAEPQLPANQQTALRLATNAFQHPVLRQWVAAQVF